MTIRYSNHKGENKSFEGDKRTLRKKGRFVSLQVAPTGQRCSFKRDRIQNLDEVLEALPAVEKLSGVERQILGYHRKKGTTSSRYEEVIRKLEA